MSEMSTGLMDTKRLALLLGVSPRTVLRLVETNKIPHIRLGRSLRFDYDDVMQSLKQDSYV